MEYLSLDLLIVIAFLLISLGIGLRAGRGIKDIRDYALANKSYGTTALVLTYLATDIGGGTILGNTKEVFTNGIIMTAALMGWSFSFVLRAIFIAPRMHHFEGCLTLGDVMGSLYGTRSKIITGILGLFSSITLVGLQLSALGLLFESLLGIKASWGVLVGGLSLAIYTALGGIKAVTATDIFQFLVLYAIIPLVATIALNRAGGFMSVVEIVPAERFIIWSHKDFSAYFTIFLVWGLFSVEITTPASMQRILMAKNAKQLRDMLLNVAVFDASFRLIIMVLGLAGLALYPNIAPDTFVPHLVQELLPTGLKGLAIAGILAMIVSTADSHLHAAGLTLAHDVVKTLAQRYRLTINELRWARYATLIIGCLAIVVGLKYHNLLKLSVQSRGFIGPILAVPLIAGIMGLKPSQRAFYTAMVATLASFLISKILLPASQQYLVILIGLIVNTLVFFGINLLAPQGNTSN